MTGVDYFQIIFLVIVVSIGLGGFIWAINKED
jgi:preprotein translocase subunit SecE